MRYHPFLIKEDVHAELDTVADLSKLPILWAVPDLIPCHRLTLITGPSGVGLTDLACRLLAQTAPLNHLLDVTPLTTGTTTGTAGVSPAYDNPPPQQEPGANDPSRYGIIDDHYDSPFLPEELIPDPDDPDWDPNLPLVPDTKPAPIDPVLPTALLISARDEGDVLRPRLLSAGADPNRILVLSEMIVPDDDPADPSPIRRPFTLKDCGFLDRMLHEHKSIRLVIIDSAEMLYTYEARPNRSTLQRQFYNLLQVARQREVAIVLITPIPRIGHNPFRSALLGTLNEVCRRVFLLAPDPQSPDHRYLFCLKNTLPTPIPTLQLKPSGGPLLNLQSPISNLQSSSSPLTYSAYLQLIRRRPGPIPHARLQAQKFLTELLSQGALPVGNHKHPPDNSIRAQVIAAGLSWGTIRRAATEMNLSIFRDADCWYWQLPPAAQSQPGALAPTTCAPSPIPTQKPTHSVGGSTLQFAPEPDLAAPTRASSPVLEEVAA